MMIEKSREQELINILFQVAILTKENKMLQKMDREEYGKWVRHQLRECGYDTFPCGSSWAVLNWLGGPPSEIYTPLKQLKWYEKFKLFKK